MAYPAGSRTKSSLQYTACIAVAAIVLGALALLRMTESSDHLNAAGEHPSIRKGSSLVSGPRSSLVPPTHKGSVRDRIDQSMKKFYAEIGMAPGTLPPIEVQYGPPSRQPEFRFWVEMLNSPDSELAGEAFRMFAAVARTGYHLRPTYTPEMPFLEGVEGEVIFRAAKSNYDIGVHQGIVGANTDQNNPLGALHKQPAINTLIEAVAPYLEDPSKAEDARQIVDLFTINAYEGRDAKWWRESYPRSMLASVFRGEPRSVWSALPE